MKATKTDYRTISIWIVILSIMLLLSICVCTAEAETVASGECGKNGDHLTWVLDDEGKLTITGTGDMNDYGESGTPWYELRTEINRVVVGENVTGIGNFAFYNCKNLTSVTLPDQMSRIGEYAFALCTSLPEVALPEGITVLSRYAFAWSGITGITIPEGVTQLAAYSIYNCLSLKEIDLPSTLQTINMYVFVGCNQMENYHVAEGNTVWSSIDGVLIKTERNALTNTYQDMLTMYPKGRTASHYTVPDGVAVLYSDVFKEERDLISVTIPTSVTWIATNAFTNASSLTHIYFMGTQDEWESVRKDPGNSVDYLATATVICNYQSQTWSEPTYEWAEDNRMVTATRTYQPDPSLSETETVEVIAEYITEPTCTEAGTASSAMAVFANPAFMTQTKTDVTIGPKGHTPVAVAAVPATCTGEGLTEGSCCSVCGEIITEQESIPALEHDPETDMEAVAATCTTAGWTAASHCNRCGIVLSERTEIPALGHEEVIDEARAATCTESGLTAGSHCDRCGIDIIKQETIPELGHDPVVDEGYPATYMADGLTEGSHCRRCNISLVTQETIPMLTAGGTCGENLTWTFRAGVLTITGTGDMNDYGEGGTPWYDLRTEINRIVVGENVTGIGNFAFYNCKNLTSVTLPDQMSRIGEYAFALCTSLPEVALPEGITVLSRYAFAWSGITGITIPEGVTQLAAYSIYNCLSLKEIDLPSTLQTINMYVFVGCNQMENYHVAEGNTVWSSIDGVLIKTERNALTNTYQDMLTMYPKGRTASHYTVPDGVAVLYSDVFKEERDLISVTIPTSVTWIATNAFTNASSLTHIYFMGTQDEWESVRKDPGNSVDYLATATVICNYQSQTWSEPTYEWAEDNRMVTATRTYQPDPSLSETETVEVIAEYITEPTCTEAGTASSAMAVFANPAFMTQTKTDVTIGPKGHTPVAVAAVPATCTGEGLTEGSCCSVCGEIITEQESIPALGHEWGEASYVWADDNSEVTATRVCRHDNSHVETEKVGTTAKNTLEATCETTGQTTYTSAVFENAAFEVQSRTLNVAALGHAWGTPAYEWTEDHKTVTAIAVCAHDTKHQQSETVSVSPVVTVSPEENTPGTVAYRAVFENDLFSPQEETEAIHALKDLHVLRLPASLTGIETEAFEGIAAEAILVPESCTDIAPKAFINCGQLYYIRIPAGVEIPEDAFIGCPNVIIDQK